MKESKKWIGSIAVLGLLVYVFGYLDGRKNSEQTIVVGSEQMHIDTIKTIRLNGVDIAYRAVGNANGEPIVLLHGNRGRHEDLNVMAAQLDSAGYMVYAMDSRGQGRNEEVAEYHYADMADDVYAFCKAKELKAPKVFGWSDGGIVAILSEIRHPHTFATIAVSGVNITPEGIVDFEGMKKALTTDSLGNVREPRPIEKMMLTEPNITEEELRTIACPTLVVVGEHDLIKIEQTLQIANAIAYSTLCVLPGEDHGSHIWQNKKMGEVLLDYLHDNELTAYWH